MKQFPLLLALLAIGMTSALAMANVPKVAAQTDLRDAQIITDLDSSPSAGTDSSLATESAEASISAEVAQLIQEKKEQDITETTGRQRSELFVLLEENPPGPVSWHNFLQHAIRQAVNNGLATNIVVLIILFPIITSVIAASRHLIGLKGFGIYAPAVLSVAFVSTGITTGLAMFITVFVTALISRTVVKKLKLQYLPRTAMLLWGVSVTILLLLVATSYLGLTTFLTINIFPLLIIMLLTENFMETQLMSSQSQAFRLTLETVLIAIACSLIISSRAVQHFVLLNPELTILSVALINIIVGKYSGLRFLEYFRFQSVIKR